MFKRERLRVRVQDREKESYDMCIGVNSIVNEKNFHSLLVDCDNTSLRTLFRELPTVIEEYSLPTVFIVHSSMSSFHLVSFTKRKWQEVLSILRAMEDRGLTDSRFIYNCKRKGYSVIRVSGKRGKNPPTLLWRLEGNKLFESKKVLYQYFKVLASFSSFKWENVKQKYSLERYNQP